MELGKRVTAQNPRMHWMTSGRNVSIVSNETRVIIQDKRPWALEFRRMQTAPRKQCR